MVKRIISIIASLLGLYLLVSLIGSMVISSVYLNKSEANANEVVVYAKRFLDDENLMRLGTKLDCSGFTKNVYAKFGVKLPASSFAQYDFKADILPQTGDLVFFAINGERVNHVGIIINDSTFIHSPGKGRAVQIDDLNADYWQQYYKGTGKVSVKK